MEFTNINPTTVDIHSYPTQASSGVFRSFNLMVSDALPPVVYRPLFYGQSQKIEWQANCACKGGSASYCLCISPCTKIVDGDFLQAPSTVNDFNTVVTLRNSPASKLRIKNHVKFLLSSHCLFAGFVIAVWNL